MLVSRRNILTGKNNTLELPVTKEQLKRHKEGELVQKVFPHLDAEQREFIISGLMPGEFDRLFGELTEQAGEQK